MESLHKASYRRKSHKISAPRPLREYPPAKFHATLGQEMQEPPRRINRRQFLKICAMGAVLAKASLILGASAPIPPENYHYIGEVRFDTNKEVSFVEAYRLLQWVEHVRKQVSREEFVASQEALEQWVKELAPFFAVEGFVSRDVYEKRYPHEISFGHYSNVFDFYGTYGRTHNEGNKVDLSDRFTNIFFEAYGDALWLWVAAHEEAHQVAGIVHPSARTVGDEYELPDPRVEPTANLMALEVLATKVLSENKTALHALLIGMSFSAVNSVVFAGMHGKTYDLIAPSILKATENVPYALVMGDIIEQVKDSGWFAFQFTEQAWQYGGAVIEEILVASLDPKQKTQDTVKYDSSAKLLKKASLQLDSLLTVLNNLEELVAYFYPASNPLGSIFR